MKEDLISFETAKLAKEKGFYWESFNVFIKEEEYKSIRCPIPEKWNSITNSKKAISRPTQSLLQKWLREEHEIVLIVGLDDYADCNTFKFTYWGYKKGDFKPCVKTDEMYSTWEEALEKGLEEALKLINN